MKIWDKFVKYNQRYDSLADTDPALRFALFLAVMVGLLSTPLFLQLIFRVEVPQLIILGILGAICLLRICYLYRNTFKK